MLARALLAVIACSALLAAAQPAGSLITSLPGWNDTLPTMYSGYLSANETDGRELFYWFVESANSPSTDPVVVWLNGGPGCSSMDGFFYEHGPLHINPDLTDGQFTLYANPYSWNLVANMLYIDSPAGVGFSYTPNAADQYSWTDDKVANETYYFLQQFFKAYPQFSENDFYVSGESYAGHYVPTLAHRVFMGNNNGESQIPLKGILVGNGVTDDVADGNGYVPFLCMHALISDEMCDALEAACCTTESSKGQDCNYGNNPSTQCNDLINEAVGNIGDINVYNIYDDCANPNLTATFGKNKAGLADLRTRYSLKARYNPNDFIVPCMNFTLADGYLNNPAVRAAIHAKPIAEMGVWKICNMTINENYNPGYASMLPFYSLFLANNIRILAYSGDVDSAVCWVGTEAAIDSLGLETVTAWHPWHLDQQVAGYAEEFAGGLTYATVRGSGHTVPQYRPPQALLMFTTYINGNPL